MADDDPKPLVPLRPLFGGELVGQPEEGQIVIGDSQGRAIQIPEVDRSKYSNMQQLMQMLLATAQEMGGLSTMDKETRDLQKKCRMLALDLQSELERRLG